MGLFSTAVIAQYGPPINIDYLIIGGGGGSQAYDSTRSTGGGGAGGFLSGSTTITPGYTNLAVSVGPGGLRQADASVANGPGVTGNNSIFLGLIAYGGGGGATSGYIANNGLPGGSGGGGGAQQYRGTPSQTGSGGTGVAGQGFNGGGSYTAGGNGIFRQGQGGGAGGAATDASAAATSVPGIEKAWLDGFKYAGGGGLNAYITSGSGGQTQNNTTNGTEGKNGLVKLRYTGSVALFTGGNIAISGGYVYHSFNVGTQPAFAPGVNTDYTLYYTGG